jgi:hypothetical protein
VELALQMEPMAQAAMAAMAELAAQALTAPMEAMV